MRSRLKSGVQMLIVESEECTIFDPTKEILDWIESNLTVENPEYSKKLRMGFYLGKTPRVLRLYTVSGNNVTIPYGAGKQLLTAFPDLKSVKLYVSHSMLNYHKQDVEMYEYQKDAMDALIEHGYGILQSPAGSGKTQIAIALIQKTGFKTLWLTHTIDLLIQSKERAEKYVPSELIGTITEGKVNVGEGITFATVQTMRNLDLSKYKNNWDLVIVDECHRVAGTPTSMTMFSEVLNSLNAEHKIGLSATVHRADGLIKATYALLGQIVHTVPQEAVEDRVMKVTVQPVYTNTPLTAEMLNADGTLNYAKMLTGLANDETRNQLIASYVDGEHSTLILSDRLSQLKHIMSLIYDTPSVLIDGKTKKSIREKALQDVREGKVKVLLATYSLAKEGLDAPILSRLLLATPQKDYAIVTQSLGRIARTFDGKEDAVAYDFVDENRYLVNSFKMRCRTYKKLGYEVKDE